MQAGAGGDQGALGAQLWAPAAAGEPWVASTCTLSSRETLLIPVKGREELFVLRLPQGARALTDGDVATQHKQLLRVSGKADLPEASEGFSSFTSYSSMLAMSEQGSFQGSGQQAMLHASANGTVHASARGSAFRQWQPACSRSASSNRRSSNMTGHEEDEQMDCSRPCSGESQVCLSSTLKIQAGRACSNVEEANPSLAGQWPGQLLVQDVEQQESRCQRRISEASDGTFYSLGKGALPSRYEHLALLTDIDATGVCCRCLHSKRLNRVWHQLALPVSLTSPSH